MLVKRRTGSGLVVGSLTHSQSRAQRLLLSRFSHDRSSGLAEIFRVLQLNVCAKHFLEHFIGFWLRILWMCHGLFDADDLMTRRALAEAMTGVIHFVPWSKPPQVGQFWCSHVHSFPQAGADCQPCGFRTAPLPPGQAQVRRSETRECCSGLRRKSDAGAQPQGVP